MTQRRPSLALRRTLLLSLLATPMAFAMRRASYGGSLRMKLPLAFHGLDPHTIDDPTTALFADAAFDTLYALDSRGKPFPALASRLPEAVPGGARLTLRPGLLTALGKPLLARDVVFSMQRAARSGARAWLSQYQLPQAAPRDPLGVVFPGADPQTLALSLASPVTAIVPHGFNRLHPDGTGAFRAFPAAQALTLKRNPNASRGAAFLDRIEARSAQDLSDALRAFEAGEVDIGWLGKGLHQPRVGARSFSAGALGWVVLHSGLEAQGWGGPGVTQKLLNELPVDRLQHLGLRGIPPNTAGSGWRGPKGSILVDAASPQLREIAASLASLMSRSGHELEVLPRSQRELSAAKRSRQFLLLLDFARRIGQGPRATVASLYTAASPALAQNPPRLQSDARTIARSLSLGVVGELHAYGAHLPALLELSGWQLSRCWLDSAG